MKVYHWAEKLDKIIFKFMYGVSILAAVALMAVAVLCTVDSLSAKFFSVSVPNGQDWVTYLIIPIVFLAMGYLQVERGNTVVDLLSNKFPKALNHVLQIFGNILGAVLSAYLAYCEFGLMASKLSTLAKSSSSANAFFVWPFAMIVAVGYLLVAVSFAWCAVRVVVITPHRRMGYIGPKPEDEQDLPKTAAASDRKGEQQ